jgi:hypothetical protein
MRKSELFSFKREAILINIIFSIKPFSFNECDFIWIKISPG